MIVSNVQRETIGLVTNLLQIYTTSMSEAPALVGFRLIIDGVLLTPVGGFTGTDIKTFSLSPQHTGEITYERVAAYLVNDEISLADRINSTPIRINDKVMGYSKTIRIDKSSDAGSIGNIIAIPYTGDLVCKGNKFDCCGDFKTVIFEFLFVARNELKFLPPEFDAFRIWDNWLTLGKSYSSIARVLPSINDEEELYSIEVQPKYSELTSTIANDVKNLANIFS